MNNDLISRSALKGIIETYRPIKCFTDKDIGKNRMVDFCLAEIDNAPTADITEEQAIDKLHKTGWLPMHDKEMTERPQGEWIDHSCYKDVIICSNCNSGDSRWHKDFKFCPNCGAELKGGAE